MTPWLDGCWKYDCQYCRRKGSAGASYRNVHQFDPVGIADQIVAENDGTLKSRVGPSRRVRVCNVEFGNGDGLDLVGLLGHVSQDGGLVGVVEDRWHIDVGRRLGHR